MTARRIALVGPALVVVVLALVLWRAGDDGQRDVTAVFEQTQGLVAGNDVWAGGAVVGSVERIRLGSDGLPHVRMRIDRGYPLRRGATADLRLFSNSGQLNRIIVLSSGKGPALADGATIAAANTDEPVELDDVLNTLTPRMRRDLRAVVGRLDDSTRGLDRAFRGSLRSSGRTLHESAGLMRAASTDGQAMRTLVARSAEIAGALAEDPGAAAAATDQLDALLADTARRSADLRAATAALPSGLREPRLALDELNRGVPALRRFLAAADPVSRRLAPTAVDLTATLRRARPVLRDATKFSRASPPSLRRLGRVLRSAAPLARTLTPTLRDALPALDVLRVYTPEAASFLANWSSMTTSYDASGNAIRILPTVAPAPNKLIAPSTWGPGLLDAPYLRQPGSLVDQPWTDFRSSFLSRGRQNP